MADDTITQVTEVKTLWTETILEVLYAALKSNKSDSAIKDIIKEVREKGFKDNYLVEKVEKKVDRAAALRLKTLLK